MVRGKRSKLAKAQDRDECTGRFCRRGDGGAVKPAAQRCSVPRRRRASSSESGDGGAVKPAAQRCSVPRRRRASSSESCDSGAVKPAAQRCSVPRNGDALPPPATAFEVFENQPKLLIPIIDLTTSESCELKQKNGKGKGKVMEKEKEKQKHNTGPSQKILNLHEEAAATGETIISLTAKLEEAKAKKKKIQRALEEEIKKAMGSKKYRQLQALRAVKST